MKNRPTIQLYSNDARGAADLASLESSSGLAYRSCSAPPSMQRQSEERQDHGRRWRSCSSFFPLL